MSNHTDFKEFFRAKGIFMILHILILLLSILLIVLISVDTFHNINFYDQPKFEKWQVWICCVFLADFFIEWILSKNKKHYLLTHFIFFLVSIPYQALIYRYGLDQYISKELSYIIRYMPLIRGGYALAIVVGWFTSNKATGLFFSYIIILLSTVYFSSLTFFLFEKGVNPLVKDYTDALWWAAMDVTTVGSNIVAVTGVGRVLSVLLAALGMMMFPIFTVYVTNLITKRNQEAVYSASFFNAFKNYEKNHPENNSNNASDAPGDNKTPETANTSSDE
ncbi:MAG: two pore domain potassium channel family protein [Bacteroides sp.]|nr:two pore domain potassium channel family protein [Bacteroides sp.]MBD5348783.1 two pore domain potassium channel family protein [Bacteroides sp.]